MRMPGTGGRAPGRIHQLNPTLAMERECEEECQVQKAGGHGRVSFRLCLFVRLSLSVSLRVLAQSLVNHVRWGHYQTAHVFTPNLACMALGSLPRLFLVTHLLLLRRLLAAKTRLCSLSSCPFPCPLFV